MILIKWLIIIAIYNYYLLAVKYAMIIPKTIALLNSEFCHQCQQHILQLIGKHILFHEQSTKIQLLT